MSHCWQVRERSSSRQWCVADGFVRRLRLPLTNAEWEVTRNVFRVGWLEASETVGFSTISRRLALLIMVCLSSSRDMSFSWRTPPRSSGAYAVNTNRRVTCQSMAELCDAFSHHLRLLLDWVDYGVRSSGDLQNPVGRCIHFVYSVVLKWNKVHLHLLWKFRQEKLSKQTTVKGPLNNDPLTHNNMSESCRRSMLLRSWSNCCRLVRSSCIRTVYFGVF